MQVIGNQLFVTSALQDAAKHDPVVGVGNGIVSVFDFQGRFVRRFATAGPLNAPWGITQASANFGPFSNDILIGNAGDGTINAFDPTTGNFAGQIKDGDGNAVVNAGLHALAFRSDQFADPDTLFFSAGINNGLDGLFGAITTGLVSTTRVSVPSTPANTPVPFTVTVSAGPGNPGTPIGLIDVQDGGVAISHVSLTNGVSIFPEILTGVRTHLIEVKYSGDAKFLPSSSQTEVQVTGPATTLNLVAPASAAPGSPVTMTATIRSDGGTPTGQIVFLDGNTSLGNAPLNAVGVATLTVNTLAAGAHSLTASFAGDGNFGGSTSPSVNTTIITRDFSLGAAPTTATVTTGQSALFNLTVTPAGGFADPVTFSCPVLTGITCSFSPPTVTPNAGAATTMLTVTTSMGVTRYGQAPGTPGSGFPLATLGLIGALALFTKKTGGIHIPFLKVAASALSVLALALTLVSCGGYTTSGQTNRGTASITVMAQSGTTSHTTNISVTVQ
jgi:Bacterial Ig-like domain (group 3)